MYLTMICDLKFFSINNSIPNERNKIFHLYSFYSTFQNNGGDDRIGKRNIWSSSRKQNFCIFILFK